MCVDMHVHMRLGTRMVREGWLARHSTIKETGPPHHLDVVSMGTEQCAALISLLKLKLWLKSI